MNWTVLKKSDTERPTSVSNYKEYKPFLRTEANNRCVYCAVHENPLGGYDFFHVEHFRPKSLPQFTGLLKNYNNLFYACAICNRFKSNDWPNDPIIDNSIISYPDPNLCDYNTLFDILDDGKLQGKFVASKYILEKINLNRPQLINERRENLMRFKSNALINVIQVMIANIEGAPKSMELQNIIMELLSLTLSTIKTLHEEKEICRYEPSEIRRLTK